jgi:hypothetical protein
MSLPTEGSQRRKDGIPDVDRKKDTLNLVPATMPRPTMAEADIINMHSTSPCF